MVAEKKIQLYIKPVNSSVDQLTTGKGEFPLLCACVSVIQVRTHGEGAKRRGINTFQVGNPDTVFVGTLKT